MKNNVYLHIFVFFLISLFVLPAFSDGIDLENEEPTWQTVLSGNPVSCPLRTTYGFAAVTDGHQIVACSNNGTVLWQQRVRGFPTPYFSVARGDFLYVVTSENKLNLINPSGMTLWSEYVPFDEIIAPPTAGADGRMFVQGKTEIACYALNGKLKWTLDAGEMDSIPLFTLNDGSIVAFLKKNDDGKTTGIRISPFGEKIEEITFGGKIAKAYECSEGLFLAFTDGSVGLCKIEDNTAKSAWLLVSSETGFSALSPENTELCASENTVVVAIKKGSGSEITVFNAKNHEITAQFAIHETSFDAAGFFTTDGENITLAGNSKAASYSLSGDFLWSVTLPNAKGWEYAFFLDDGQITFSTKNWVVKSYRVFQHTKEKSAKTDNNKKEKPQIYQSFFSETKNIDGYSVRALEKSDYEELVKKLNEGEYSSLEQKWIQVLKHEAKEMAEFYESGDDSASRDVRSKFRSDIVYQQELCSLMALFGSSIFAEEIARLLHSVTDKQMLVFLLNAVGKIGYDEDGSLLREIEFVETRRALPSDSVLLKACADAAYSVCRVMGRPALYARGKAILAYMLYPQYDKKIREYARRRLQDIIKLGI